MKQKQLIIGLVGAVLLVNGIGFLIVRKTREAAKPAEDARTVAAAQKASEASRLRQEAEENAKARRAAGVAALEAGDYDKALINFTEAQELIGADAKVSELLRITKDLRDRQQAAAAARAEPPPAEKPTPPAPTPPPERERKPTRPARVAAPAKPAPEPEKVAEARPTETPAVMDTTSGMLLVSTTPRGLLVQVDGQSMDLTPMRVAVKLGMHRVALYDGDRKLYETSIEVFEGKVATVLKDLSAELAPAKAPEPRVEPTRVEPKPTPVAAAAPPPAPPPAPAPSPAPVPVKPAAPVPAATGGLELTSPGLYGEIWVAGRPYGFPPVKVEGLSPGSVKIEVRVNGAVKRSTTAVVEAGQLKPVRVR